MKKTQFYVVATPIGNLEDISQRALKILSEVDYIACEDTRVTKKLLDRYNISTKLFAYHKFNEKLETQKILELLENDKTIALVSDAGTPCVCDPGKILLEALYENGIKIESVAGACAISTFLSLVPRKDEQFAFVGFIDRTLSKQEKVFEQYKNIDTIFYESPNRLVKTLENIKQIRGENVKVAVGRELTKMFEEVFVDRVDEVINFYTNKAPKGEIVCMIYKDECENIFDIDIESKVKVLSGQGFSNKDILKILVSLYGLNKNELYKILN